MNILVFGGTRYFGKHLLRSLLLKGHNVTIATRGNADDDFGNSVTRIRIERTDPLSLSNAFAHKHFDIIYDSLAYCSNDVKHLLDIADCDKYIMTSSTAVYQKHIDTREAEFDPINRKLLYCDRATLPYDEGKRQAECALWQNYPQLNAVAVRFPFVVGRDDYTKRLLFYVDHIINEKPLAVDNFESQMSFVRSDEAGEFLSYFAENNYCGPINGSSEQTISIHDIAEYVRKKTGKGIILTDSGEAAPFNGENKYSINTDKAKSLGFHFPPLKEWIYDLIDFYIQELST